MTVDKSSVRVRRMFGQIARRYDIQMRYNPYRFISFGLTIDLSDQIRPFPRRYIVVRRVVPHNLVEPEITDVLL